MASPEIQSLVDELAEQLQRSVVIDDPGLGLLYSSAHFGDEDPVRIDSMLNRRTDSKVIGHVLAHGVLSWTRPGMISPSDELGLHSRVCVPVRWQGELVALIMVMDSDGSLTTAETRRISDVADRVAPLLVTELKPADQPGEQLVLGLVSSDPTLRRQALGELSQSGSALVAEHVTAIRLLVGSGEGEASSAHVTVALRSALALPGPTGSTLHLAAVTAPGGVVIIGGRRAMTHGAAQNHAQRMIARVDDLSSGRFRAYAGIGPAVTGIDRAHESAELAGLAVAAAEVGVVDVAAQWEDLGPYGPLMRIPPHQRGAGSLPSEVRRLLEVDRDGALLETLRVFLDVAGAASAASAALQIHRTTLYYRLSRVEELLGVDLSDGRTRLTLHLGIALLDSAPGHRQT
ncbi:helix-turn-helix domain-containing protein [Nocardioides astragali]|uniref:Helix-turn-helix domain-containing protein n=1 Tax=Nocardioides astragali TaxID=1776736 RepID=A0ABW2NB66_9ACTN|nr:helix-turn-helix domain-containing protein [Nocardioides astragali]